MNDKQNQKTKYQNKKNQKGFKRYLKSEYYGKPKGYYAKKAGGYLGAGIARYYGAPPGIGY